jgi:hypothetical protein
VSQRALLKVKLHEAEGPQLLVQVFKPKKGWAARSLIRARKLTVFHRLALEFVLLSLLQHACVLLAIILHLLNLIDLPKEGRPRC